jgi:hypothetical protein
MAAACVERELEQQVDGDGGAEAHETAHAEEAISNEDELLHKIDMWYKLLGKSASFVCRAHFCSVFAWAGLLSLW